jgi:hypothetical protein
LQRFGVGVSGHGRQLSGGVVGGAAHQPGGLLRRPAVQVARPAQGVVIRGVGRCGACVNRGRRRILGDRQPAFRIVLEVAGQGNGRGAWIPHHREDPFPDAALRVVGVLLLATLRRGRTACPRWRGWCCWSLRPRCEWCGRSHRWFMGAEESRESGGWVACP